MNWFRDLLTDLLITESYLQRKIDDARHFELSKMDELNETKDKLKKVQNNLERLELSSKKTFLSAVLFAETLDSKQSIVNAIRCLAKRRQGQLISAPIRGNNLDYGFHESVHFIPDRNNNPFYRFIPPFAEERSQFPLEIIEYIYENCRVKKNKTIHLNKDIILPWPWHSLRLKRALSKIGEKFCKPWKQDNNHGISFWEPIGIGWVNGGNHSLTAGIAQGEGVVELEHYYDITPIYSMIMCDGDHYIDLQKNEIIAPVVDHDIAAIFEMGRLLTKKED